MPWILQREERGCYRTLLDELIATEIPGYRNFARMQPGHDKQIIQRMILQKLNIISQRLKPNSSDVKVQTSHPHEIKLFKKQNISQAKNKTFYLIFLSNFDPPKESKSLQYIHTIYSCVGGSVSIGQCAFMFMCAFYAA